MRAHPALTEEHEAWRETVRRFVEREILPHAAKWDEAGEFPRELYRKAAAAGLLLQAEGYAASAFGEGHVEHAAALQDLGAVLASQGRHEEAEETLQVLLDEMEARVDIGEIDVVLIQPGQRARLEVDAFKDRKFTGLVTEIANSSKGAAMSSSQEATKFEVRIRIQEKEAFRPGMTVTAEVETCYRTNALAVPFASVTTRTF